MSLMEQSLRVRSAHVLSHPFGAPDLGRAEAKVRGIVRFLVLGWIGFNLITYAPSVDAHGNCGCPFCNPLSPMGATP